MPVSPTLPSRLTMLRDGREVAPLQSRIGLGVAERRRRRRLEPRAAQLVGPDRGRAMAIAAHLSQTRDVIADDPGGFRLPEAFVALNIGLWEVFLNA